MNLPTPHTSFPGALWPAVPPPPAAAFLAVLGQLERTQFLAPEELVTSRLPQIAALVDHACRAFPFWKRRFATAGLDRLNLDPKTWQERWAALPVLTRAEVQELGNKLRNASLPAGHGNIIENVTSGSSGRPVRFARTTLDLFYLQAFQLREHLWRSRDFSGKFLSIVRDEQRKDSAEGVHLRRMESWGPPVSAVWPTGPYVLVDYRAPVAALIETIRKEAPDYLCSFPSLLCEIARQIRDAGVSMPPLRETIGMGEASPPELAELCREVWSAPYTSTYTAAECGAIAYQCQESRYHIQSESSLVEVLNSQDQRCQPGETGRVVLTPLHNFAMPLFRYEIGDMAALGEGPCPCGRRLPVLSAIPGRARDLLQLPSGDLRPPYYGHGAVMKVRAIRQHQVVQTAPSELCFRLVVARPLTPQEEQHIIHAASEATGHELTVRIEYVPEIQRRPSGKFAEFERQF